VDSEFMRLIANHTPRNVYFRSTARGADLCRSFRFADLQLWRQRKRHL